MLERFLVPEADRVYVQHDRMHDATSAIFSKMGLTDEDAKTSADALMTSDLRGCESHGVSNMLRRYVDWLIDRGVHGLYPNGSTGEFTRFTAEERRRIIEIIADQNILDDSDIHAVSHFDVDIAANAHMFQVDRVRSVMGVNPEIAAD